MTVMARDRGYDELLGDVRGRRVLVWTCNTCARLCNIGGREAEGKPTDGYAERMHPLHLKASKGLRSPPLHA